ncbi:MAG: hypothetical protein ACJ786_36160 [Catenulispora sp.]|jgi:hypothetical protein
MPKAELRHGSHIETLNQQELEELLSKQTVTYFQEQARGFTTARFGDLSTVATGAVSVPATDETVFGPDKGFAWAVQRVSAAGLAAADVLKVYRDVNSPLNFLGYITATANFAPGSKGVVLRGGEKLIVAGTGLTATGDIVVTGEAVQVAELDIYKIL